MPYYQRVRQSDTFIIISESPLTRCHHPGPMVYISAHSRCWHFCGNGQVYNGTCPPFQYYTEYFRYPKNPLCSPVLATPALFTVSIILPFLECDEVEIIIPW